MSLCSIHAFGRRPPDVGQRHYVPVFRTAPEARSWFSAFIKGTPHHFEDDLTVVLEHDFAIKLRSREWPLIMASPVSNEPLPQDELRLIARFKRGTWDEVPVVETPVETQQKPAQPERLSKAQRPPGYVTITELCSASGVPASEARVLLRSSGLVKPDYGWAFAPDKVAEIKKLCGLK